MNLELDHERRYIGIEALDEIQKKVLDLLSGKEKGSESFLYYNSANSGGARPKMIMTESDGTHWLVKFRHTYDSPDIRQEEYLYMNTAAECGITVPKIRLLKDRYFAIERFDIENGK